MNKKYDRIPLAWFTQLSTDKLATRGLVVLIVYSAVRSLVLAASKPFWSDELITLCVARQPRVSLIWQALRSAVDAVPPPFYLVERFAGGLVPDQHLAFRIPFIIAFCISVLCIFSIVKKRSSGGFALLCAAIPLMSVLYDIYAVEARPYALVLACVAIAIVAYQRAESSRWWVLILGISLFTAEALHYYAVFALVPFGLAEIARFTSKRQPRPLVWLAIICSLIPLGIFWPLLWGYKSYYTHFWGTLSLLEFTNVYGWFFGLSTAWGIGVFALAFSAVVGAMLLRGSPHTIDSRSIETPFQEYVLVVSLLILPFVIFVAMKIAHGGLVNRYMLISLLGFPLVAGYTLPHLDRKVSILFGVFLFSCLATQECRFWFHQRGHMGKVTSPAKAAQEVVSATGYENLPVLVSDGTVYLQLFHYASPGWAKRFVAVVDAPKSITYLGTDSVDKNLLALRPYLPLQVQKFDDFNAKHAEFLLLSSQGSAWDWWPNRLMDDGYSLRLLALRDNLRVYLVSAPTRR
jgi:hypothetical protein